MQSVGGSMSLHTKGSENSTGIPKKECHRYSSGRDQVAVQKYSQGGGFIKKANVTRAISAISTSLDFSILASGDERKLQLAEREK